MVKPKTSIIVSLIVLVLGLGLQSHAQTSGALGAIPPTLLPQIQQLAGLLQRNVATGKLSDAHIQRELQQGNLAAMIRSLGPEAANLLDQIKATLQSNYTEVELNVVLQGLLGSAPQSILPPTR